ncbi:3-deoxy-8-phosphooctulonate synthase [Candidatus Sulfurimonas marisnigri]|uniref:2-dehydro-3-deoxyphosphooctonate aldolase n=1 Tax=Candidatus Sulfurimonas marisnigri TaxID=2740405 RepID=A0A7S7M0Y8_9BACT|nr:3-deoxy-8-phosphooctulonate synthase [Candidatus Sulfurimonas marisnigri]QOY55000.1 3-deoxy-8-phosphooctulonate synthase [Candidatus Sulfurimonas marisnigri]
MTLLAGPCVIESEENIFKIAKSLEKYHEDKTIDFYFKASFDKANRTSLDSFRGPGIEEGLRILQKVKDDFGYKIVTDVHESVQVKPVAEVVDMLQIPAFLCRQTDLLVACANTDKIVNIKKGQFINPPDMQYSVMKVLKTRGCDEVSYENAKKHNIFLTERGSSFGYGNMVVDMRSLVVMRKFAPVLFDATHSVQMPGALGGKTGGDSSMVPYLASAAAAVGVDGFFFETHFDPSVALSDGPNMLKLDELESLIVRIKKIQEI